MPQRPVTELASIPLFSGLPGRALGRLAKNLRTLDSGRGMVLYTRGATCEGMHAVVSGRIKLALERPGAIEKVVALLGRGETFGEPAMLLDEPQFLSAATLLPTRLLVIDKSAVLACMRSDAAFATRMAVSLGRRLRRLMHGVENTTLHSGTERVVDFLVSALAGAPSNGTAVIELPARKRIIASHLDLTHEHFSRILRGLAAAQLLVVQGPRVSIPDIAKLLAYHGESYAAPAAGTHGDA